MIANSVVYAADSNFHQGFDVFAGMHGDEGRRSKMVDTRLVVDRALEFLDSRRGLPDDSSTSTPWTRTCPYSPPAPFDTMFEPEAVFPDHPGIDPRTDYKEPLDRERLIAQYDGDIAYGDQQFGRFIDELKKRGRLRRRGDSVRLPTMARSSSITAAGCTGGRSSTNSCACP